jgi:hypothetical protein
MRRMNKRATIQDFMMIGLIVLAFVMTIFLGKIILTAFNEKFQPVIPQNNVSGYNNALNGKAFVNDLNNRYANLFDWIFLLVFIGLIIVVFASFFMLDTHPALFIFVIIIFAIVLVIMAVIGNVFDLFAKNGLIANTASGFTIIPYIMDNFAFIMMVLGFVGIVLLFTRMGRGEY